MSQTSELGPRPNCLLSGDEKFWVKMVFASWGGGLGYDKLTISISTIYTETDGAASPLSSLPFIFKTRLLLFCLLWWSNIKGLGNGPPHWLCSHTSLGPWTSAGSVAKQGHLWLAGWLAGCSPHQPLITSLKKENCVCAQEWGRL